MEIRPKRRITEILFLSVLVLGAFVALMPFLYMISNSLKTYGETVTRVSSNPFSPRFWPRKLQWGNYLIILKDDSMGRYFFNSLIIALVTVSGIIVTSSLAAYGFSKMRFPGRDRIFTVLLVTLMIPETVLLIPNFLIISSFRWVDKLHALTIPFMGSAFFIFFLRQFFKQIPDALMEAAKIDGASHFTILVRIMVPLIKAPLFTVFFLAFNGSWNALQWPMVVTQSEKWRPISVAVAKYVTEAGPETQLRMASAMVALAPILVIFLIAQKQITEAITNTGMKG
ncbi:MAG: carbohydrate ABC transporter permease [Spirochaetales bacterium]|nr:carbohydrate ABC transporter permease [Spirochaetales bacterium]